METLPFCQSKVISTQTWDLGVSEGVILPRKIRVSFRRNGEWCWKVTRESPDEGEEGRTVALPQCLVVRAARECL